MSLAAAGAAMVLGLTGACGGSGDTPPDAPAPAPAASAQDTAPDEAGGDCGAAANEIKAALQVMGDVTDVAIPSCDKAVVTTSLGADGKDLAASICQNAANEASSHGVAAVSVVSSDGEELAAGTTAENCAPK
jgi:hypothetical protein